MVSVADVPHLNRTIPRTTKNGERNFRDEGKCADILFVTILDTFSPTYRHRIGVSIRSPNSDSLVVTA